MRVRCGRAGSVLGAAFHTPLPSSPKDSCMERRRDGHAPCAKSRPPASPRLPASPRPQLPGRRGRHLTTHVSAARMAVGLLFLLRFTAEFGQYRA